MTTAYIGLGSNLGDRKGHIDSAIKLLADKEHIELGRVSDIIETAPLAMMEQPKYLNAVAEVKTTLSPEDLHKEMLEIESSLGREKKEKWSSRIIDLDLLLFDKNVITHTDLIVPHPQMHLRSFVLKGLCQLNGNLLHPVIKEPISVLAERLNGRDFALNPDIPQLVSIAGVIGVGKTTLAEKLSDLLGCKCIFEAYDKNPYLSQVYAGDKELALDSQLYFLTSRIVQLNPGELTPGQIAITDYVFEKELIYARRLLNAEQLSLYEKVYLPFKSEVTQPVLVVCLTDSVKNCLDRIHKRNRSYEQKIEPKFLQELDSDYQRLFADWQISPVIRISMSQFDSNKNEDLQRLANQIQYYIKTKNGNC
jgi:deoxyguanosine kinase